MTGFVIAVTFPLAIVGLLIVLAGIAKYVAPALPDYPEIVTEVPGSIGEANAIE